MRQIYIRSDGRVQFFTFTPLMQAICAGASLLVLGWVAFTSVNVIFKDRILSAKERHLAQMQIAYENRIADLQLSYDELSSALVAAEDRFKAVADSVEAKQRTIAQLLEQKDSLRASLVDGTPPNQTSARVQTERGPVLGSVGGTDTENVDATVANSLAGLAPPYAPDAGTPRNVRAGAASTAPRPVEPQQSTFSRLQRSTFLGGAVKSFGSLFSRVALSRNIDSPSLRRIENERNRLVRLDASEAALLDKANDNLSEEASRLAVAMRTAGLNPKTLASRVARKGSAGEAQLSAMGGPFIPLAVSSLGTADIDFNNGLLKVMTTLEQLWNTVTALKTMPLGMPLANGNLTSGFGSRIDPFNENLAFHSGLDFSAPRGTDIHVTAPGVVVFAGRNGAYGNSVEVDHGLGMRTRYGHLSKITVAKGAHVKRGDVIGKLGSTGRSTGPHVHYEVWYDQAVRDPRKFIKAGRYVFQE